MLMSLILKFIFFSAVVCISGVYLTKTTVRLSREIGLGDVLGGLIILAVVTNLPEVAIMMASAMRHEMEIGVSNILGGIAIQTVIICLFDIFRVDKSRSLTAESSSTQMIIEGIVLIFILALLISISYLPPLILWDRIPFGELLIVISWIWGLVLIDDSKKSPSSAKPIAPSQGVYTTLKKIKWDRTLVIFLISSLVTLWGGYCLEEVSSELAKALGITGILFGATILAFVTALPEISTGLEAIFMKRQQLAISDVFGGNAFLPCLFFPAALYTGTSVISLSHRQDLYLTAIGILLTCVYTAGLALKSKREFLGVGFDTLSVFIFYVVGVVGLMYIKG